MQDVKATAEKIEAIIGYTFTNKSLCAEAAQMASPQTPVVLHGVITGLDNNKRLSILGNAVLAKAMCACWFDTRNKQGKARLPTDWNLIRNEILGNDALAGRGYELGIDKGIFIADGTFNKTPKMVATTLEAIIGAVFQDGGDQAVTRVIEDLDFFHHPLLTIPLTTANSIRRSKQI